MRYLNNNKQLNFEAVKDRVLAQARKKFKQVKTLNTTVSFNIDVKDLLPEITITPQVHFSHQAYAKMHALVKHCDKEVAWHGVVAHDPDTHKYTITDILVYPQKVTGTTVESDDDKYPMWLMTQPEEVFNNMRMQGHSHVNMGVSPSGTDKDYMRAMLTQVEDYYIFIIFNKKKQIWVELVDVVNGIVFEKSDIALSYTASGVDTWAAKTTEEYLKPLRTIQVNKKETDKSVEEFVDQYFIDRHGRTYRC